MNPTDVIDLSRTALQMALLVSLPVLGAALLVGLVVSTLQSLTQIHDQSIATVIKLVVVTLILIVSLPWLAELLVDYGNEVVEQIPSTLGGYR